MSTTLLGTALPRRFVSIVIAALFGFTLALNPVATTDAHAAISPAKGRAALRVVAQQVGVPYVWGGMSRRGFDCSGLTKYAYARVGKYLPRTAHQQYRATIKIRSGARAGDLVFFFRGGVATHMAMYAGGGWIYHAPRAGKRVERVRLWTRNVLVGRVR